MPAIGPSGRRCESRLKRIAARPRPQEQRGAAVPFSLGPGREQGSFLQYRVPHACQSSPSLWRY